MTTISARFSERYNMRLLKKFSQFSKYINISFFDEGQDVGSLFNILYNNPEMNLSFISMGEEIPNDIEIGTQEILIEKIFNV